MIYYPSLLIVFLRYNLTRAKLICQVGIFFLAAIFYNHKTMTNVVDPQQPPIEMLDAGDARPWPVRVLTILLFVQALGLIGLSIFNFDQAIFQQASSLFQLFMASITELTRTFAFGTLGLLAIVAGFGFLWLRRTAWLTGMLVQGLVLLASLGLYLRDGPSYTFAIMGYCIVMVIYLHHPDVQTAFQTKQLQENKLDEAI